MLSSVITIHKEAYIRLLHCCRIYTIDAKNTVPHLPHNIVVNRVFVSIIIYNLQTNEVTLSPIQDTSICQQWSKIALDLQKPLRLFLYWSDVFAYKQKCQHFCLLWTPNDVKYSSCSTTEYTGRIKECWNEITSSLIETERVWWDLTF